MATQPLQQIGLLRLASYPLELPALGVFVVLALARVPAALLPWGDYVLHALIWLAMYKFAFEMLVNSGKGWLRAPEGNAHVDAGQAAHHLIFQALLLALNIAVFRSFGWPAAYAAALFSGLILPGATIALAVDHGIWHALDPRRWLDAATQLGLGYLGLAALGFGIALLQSAGASLLTWPDGSILVLLAYYLFAHYLVAVCFHSIGYGLYRHHQAFGFEINPPMARTDPKADPEQALLDTVQRHLERGESEPAFALLKAGISHNKSLGVHDKFHEMLKERGDTRAILAHARERIGMLLARDETRRALAAAHEAIGLDPNFTPDSGADVGRLVQKAEAQGQHRVAVALAASYCRAFPKRTDAAHLGLGAARNLAGPLADSAAALALIDLLKSSPVFDCIAAEASALRLRILAGYASSAK